MNFCTSCSGFAKDINYEKRVREIFHHVRAASWGLERMRPHLRILDDSSKFSIQTTQNGMVELTKEVLLFCYQDNDLKKGDDRLAFILGHEIGHITMMQNDDILNRLSSLQVEFTADRRGLLFSSLAGYNPWTILSGIQKIGEQKDDDKTFFDDWFEHASKRGSIDLEKHPFPKERKDNLMNQISIVKNSIPFFRIGVRLYQVMKYQQALQFLKKCQRIFPCPEVYNNIGLIYYQLALSALAECEPENAHRFILSTLFDTTSRANIFQKKQLRNQKNCEDLKAQFFMSMEDAIYNFELAESKDASYTPAILNLSSAYIHLSRYDDALSCLRDKRLAGSNQLKLANNAMVNEYLKSGGLVNIQELINKHAPLVNDLKNHINYTEIYYNLAQMCFEKKDKNNEKKYREKYQHNKSQMTTLTSLNKIPMSPIMPGVINNKKVKLLKKIEPVEIDLQKFYLFFAHEQMNVLQCEYEIILVENKQHGLTNADIYKRPGRYFKNRMGIETFVYDKVALDIKDQKILTAIYF